MSGKCLKGVVVKRIDFATITVSVTRKVRHAVFGKVVKRFKKYLVHDPENSVQVNDVVNIVSSRPFSKRKRFILNVNK